MFRVPGSRVSTFSCSVAERQNIVYVHITVEGSSGKFSFNLKAANGQVIGTSQSYKSESGRDNGVESVKKNAPAAPVAEV